MMIADDRPFDASFFLVCRCCRVKPTQDHLVVEPLVETGGLDDDIDQSGNFGNPSTECFRERVFLVGRPLFWSWTIRWHGRGMEPQ